MAARKTGLSRRAHIRNFAAAEEALDAIAKAARYHHDDPERYQPLTDTLIHHDYFLVTADFDAYASAQRRVDSAYGDQENWFRKAVLNTAHAGWFSADRTIRGYARDIWGIAGIGESQR